MAAPEQFRLGAVLLAGGASRRFGADNKLLATVGREALLARVARAALDGGVADLIVVTGSEHAAYEVALQGLPVRLVANARWEDGLGSSIAAGVRALSADLAGAFVVPGDLPNLSSAVFRRLAGAFSEADGARVAVPVTAAGQQRNPVLWPRAQFAALAALSGDRGGKSLLDSLRAARLDVAFDDDSLFVDIDTPSDYARFIAGA